MSRPNAVGPGSGVSPYKVLASPPHAAHPLIRIYNADDKHPLTLTPARPQC